MIKNKGFSLVELMIAMTIGLMISAALIQVFIGSKKTYRTIDANETVQENMRVAMELMVESIGYAGFMSNPDQQLIFPNLELYPAMGTFVQQGIVTGDNNLAISSALDGSDRFTVRYYGHADQLNIDCLGRAVPVDTIAEVTYYVSARDAEGIAELRCSVIVRKQSGTVVSGPDEDVVISGVDDMQIRYRQSSVANYLDTPSVWTEVLAIQVGLLVSSDAEGAKEKQKQSFDLLDAGHVVEFEDAKIRHTMEKTIAIPNML